MKNLELSIINNPIEPSGPLRMLILDCERKYWTIPSFSVSIGQIIRIFDLLDEFARCFKIPNLYRRTIDLLNGNKTNASLCVMPARFVMISVDLCGSLMTSKDSALFLLQSLLIFVQQE